MGLVVLLALLWGGQAAKAPTAPGEATAPKPEWIALPDGDAVNRYYPDLALRLSLSGRARLKCDVIATGEITNCKVLEEAPVDLGFGAAGVRLSQFFRMKPTTADGQSVGGATVLIPLSFSAPDEDVATAPRKYRVALSCITWNRARLDILGDQLTASSLAQAERYARALGKEEGKTSAVIEADIASAGEGGPAAREAMRSVPFTADSCLFLPI